MKPSNPTVIQRRTFIKRAAAAASLPWLGVSSMAEADESSKTLSRKHKILACNIRTPLPQDDREGNGWEARKEFCVEVIRAQQADLIGLQECYGIQLDYLKSQLPEFGSFGQAIPGPVFNPLNAILYSKARYEVITCGGIWLSETPHIAGSISWDSLRPRFANWMDLKDRATGEVFRFWNTHFDHKGEVARREQARVLIEAAQAYPDMPQILTGDLNTDATTPPITVIKDAGWIDSYTAVNGPEDPGFTYHRFLGPKYASLAKTGKIDFIFSYGGVQPIASELILDQRNGRYPSDHYFLSAEVILKPCGKATKDA